MKVSELIKKLNALLEEQGDINVYVWAYDGQSKIYDATVELISNVDEHPNGIYCYRKVPLIVIQDE